MAQPIPVVAANSGDAQDAPAGAIPFAAYGFGGSGPVTIADVEGLQGLLDDLAWETLQLEETIQEMHDSIEGALEDIGDTLSDYGSRIAALEAAQAG